MPQFVFRRVGFGNQQVVTDGPAHQGIPLRYKNEIPARILVRLCVQSLGRFPHQDFPGFRFHESEDQAEERRLAGAGLAHERRLASRLELMAEMFHNVAVALRVTECDIFGSNSHAGKERRLPVFRFLRSGPDFFKAVHARGRVNDLRNHVQER